jgi:hypothetical protein
MDQRTPLHDQDKSSCIKTPARSIRTGFKHSDDDVDESPSEHAMPLAFVTLADIDTPVRVFDYAQVPEA